MHRERKSMSESCPHCHEPAQFMCSAGFDYPRFACSEGETCIAPGWPSRELVQRCAPPEPRMFTFGGCDI